jgi:hypothetical protein
MQKFIRFGSVWLSLLIAFEQWGVLHAQSIPVPSPKMTVVVIDGEAAIHNVRDRKPKDVVVLVRDGNRKPVPKASVRFTLPAEGPSGLFPGDTNTLDVTTNNDGYAVARGIRPNSTPGPYRIQVQAEQGEQVATGIVTQFNMSVVRSKGGAGKWVAIASIVGAAAAGGAVAALRNRGGSPTPAAAPPPTIGITPGTGTVGPPR